MNEVKPTGQTTRILGFSVPPAVAQEVERVSREERRTKSELFNEMFRVYKSYRKHWDQDDDRWVLQLIADAQRDQADHPMSIEEMLAEDDELVRYGNRQAKRLGIGSNEVDRIIHASRARHRRA